MRSDTITTVQAAKLFGHDRATVSRWIQTWLAPAVVQEAAGRRSARLSRAAVEVALLLRQEQKPFDPTQERARRDAASADLAELRLAVEKGKFLEREDVRMTWSRELVAIRNRLLAFASRLSLALGVDAAVIEEEVHQVLTELSDPERDGLGDDDAPTPKPKRKARKKATKRRAKKKATKKKATRRKAKRKAKR